MPGSPCLSKKGESNVWFIPFKFFYLGGYPSVDPWPRVLSLPRLARKRQYSSSLSQQSVLPEQTSEFRNFHPRHLIINI